MKLDQTEKNQVNIYTSHAGVPLHMPPLMILHMTQKALMTKQD